MSAIAWMKNKATVSKEITNLNGRDFEVVTHYFKGNLSATMTRQIAKELPNLINEEMQFERVLLGNSHKKTEYWHTTYNEVVPA